MNKLDLQTPDFVAENAARLAELFPNCVTETKQSDGTLKRAIDFDLLRQELSHDLVEGAQERYRLDWPGKREALATANAPIRKTLRPCKEESVNYDTTKNLYIEGDNLDALKLLQETYLGKVKIIYIDPPYNTGNDFIYDDNFSISLEEYEDLAQIRDEEGNAMFQEEKWKQNNSANGRFHSEWLSMIYPRLKIARNLLDSDGAICVSINDAELSNLQRIMDEVFGAANYVNTVSVLAKVAAGASGGGEDKKLKKNIEYILIYAKSLDLLNSLTHLFTSKPLVEVIDEMRESGESWKYTSILLPFTSDRIHYKTIKDGDGNPIHIYKRKEVLRKTISRVIKDEKISEEEAYAKYFKSIFSDTNAQTSIRSRVMEAVGSIDEGECLEVEYVPRSGKDKGELVTHTYISNTVRRVIWLSDVADNDNGKIIKREKLGTFWEDFDYNNVGREGGVPFPDGKKPISLLKHCIAIYNKKVGIFLDFFSGSGSLAHAVMEANYNDGGNRQYIAVQLPEPIQINNPRYAAAVEFYRDNNIPLLVSEIGKERIRRAGKKILEEWEAKQASTSQLLKLETENFDISAPDIGFRVLKIDSSNMSDVYYQPDEVTQDGLALQVDNLKQDRKPEDLLFQVLLDWGVDLALPINEEAILKHRVFFVADNALAACFDTGLDEAFVKELAKRQPLRAVFRDSGYASDAVKINFEQIFKALSPHTEIKTL